MYVIPELSPENTVNAARPIAHAQQLRACQMLRTTARAWGLQGQAAQPVRRACAALH